MKLLPVGALAALLLAGCMSGSDQAPASPSPTAMPEQLQPGTTWELVWGAALKNPYDITLSFDEGKITGRGPVNQYSAAVDVDASGGLRVQDIISTRKGGPKARMQDEANYFAALKGVDAWQQVGDDQLLLTASGQPSLRYALPDSPAAFGKTLLGMPLDQAKAVASDAGYAVRVVSVDGKDRPATSDYVPDRLNLSVVDGEVTEVAAG